MKKKATELEFISQINRDGSGTRKVDESYLESILKWNEDFELHCLSLSANTFIAFNFNAFVVKIRDQTQKGEKQNEVGKPEE